MQKYLRFFCIALCFLMESKAFAGALNDAQVYLRHGPTKPFFNFLKPATALAAKRYLPFGGGAFIVDPITWGARKMFNRTAERRFHASFESFQNAQKRHTQLQKNETEANQNFLKVKEQSDQAQKKEQSDKVSVILTLANAKKNELIARWKQRRARIKVEDNIAYMKRHSKELEQTIQSLKEKHLKKMEKIEKNIALLESLKTTEGVTSEHIKKLRNEKVDRENKQKQLIEKFNTHPWKA